MKFALFTFSGEGLPVAYKMQAEGHQVFVGQIENDLDTLTKEEKKTHKPEEADDKKKRLQMYDGLLNKMPAKKLVQHLLNQRYKNDWFVFMDLNTCFKYGQMLSDTGFAGNFPFEEDRALEVNRAQANEFVKEHYAGVHVGEYQEFKKIEEGIAYLKTVTAAFVLKSEGDSGDTIVGPDDAEAGKELLSDQLKLQKKEYEQMGFILEEKIQDVVELTPQIVFLDGKPLYSSLDIENKPIGSGNIGLSMGCMQNLIVQTNLEDPINILAFPPIVHEMAKKRRGITIYDISFLIDKKGVINFGEFCFNRFGWDCLPTEIAMAGDSNGNKVATRYFEALKEGSYPLQYMFGAGIRILNMDKHGKPKEGRLIEFDKDIEPDLYMMDVKKSDKIRTGGVQWDNAVITGVGNSVDEAGNMAYDYVRDYHFVDKYYRPREDFFSKDYFSSIINRYNHAVKEKLI